MYNGRTVEENGGNSAQRWRDRERKVPEAKGISRDLSYILKGRGKLGRILSWVAARPDLRRRNRLGRSQVDFLVLKV